MVAVHLYTTDNQDVMPWPNWAFGDEPDRPGWLYTPSSSVVVRPPGESAFKVETGACWPVLHNSKLYFCPQDGPGVPHFNERVQQISSYVMNGAVCGYTNMIFPSVKLGELPPESLAFWETDERYPNYFNDGASYPSEGISTRHHQGGIYGAFDGSVKCPIDASLMMASTNAFAGIAGPVVEIIGIPFIGFPKGKAFRRQFSKFD